MPNPPMTRRETREKLERLHTDAMWKERIACTAFYEQSEQYEYFRHHTMPDLFAADAAFRAALLQALPDDEEHNE